MSSRCSLPTVPIFSRMVADSLSDFMNRMDLAIGAVGQYVMLKRAESAGMIAYFMSAEEVKWRKPVQPGDVLVIEVELTKMRGKIGKAKGVCKVRGEVVSEAQVTFMLREP